VITGRSPAGDGSFISTSTFGDGDGGDISLSAGDKVTISNGGLVSADSLAQVGEGTGLAGNIAISAGNKIDLHNGTISTRAVTSDGGNVALTAKDWVYLIDSQITTSVESGFGGGGNIDIDPDFVILNNSEILANAFGGPGGNINIVADNFIISSKSRVDASSALGLNGTVNITSPDQEVAKDLAVLPENYLDVTGLISDRCSARAGTSSLVAAGPGGLTIDPDGYLPSFGAASGTDMPGNGNAPDVTSANRWWGLAVDPAVLQLAQVTCN
jgi:large exoprotein involved in heme utilization and adhesion